MVKEDWAKADKGGGSKKNKGEKDLSRRFIITAGMYVGEVVVGQ